VRLDDGNWLVSGLAVGARCSCTTGRRSSIAAGCCGISPKPSGTRISARRRNTSTTRRRSASSRAGLRAHAPGTLLSTGSRSRRKASITFTNA
jgi:hypothetical protein